MIIEVPAAMKAQAKDATNQERTTSPLQRRKGKFVRDLVCCAMATGEGNECK